MFGLIATLAFVILLLIIVYLVKSFTKLDIVKKQKKKYKKVLLSLIPLIPIILLFIIFNVVNAVVILIHLAIFILLTQIVFSVIKKNKKDYYVILIGIILTIIYLSIGVYLDYNVSETHYEIETNKDIGTDTFRIIQLSDSHIGSTFDGEGFKKHIEEISKVESDIVVITGDFVDDNTSKEDLIISCEAFSLLKPKYGIYLVYGNHDKGYFTYRSFNETDIVNELEKNNVRILRDEVVELTDRIYLIGRDDKSNQDRKSIEELTSNLDKTKYIIDLNHQPNDYENEKNAKVDLVLSGHTHGGQLFPLGYVGLLLKANDAFYGLEKRDNTNFIVNSGISDWEMDFKTGTKSEYVIIDIINK